MIAQIPYQKLNTLFLDAGGTLISINFGWVCRELKNIGISCDPEDLRRAEAASRPIIATQTDEFRGRSQSEVRELYLAKVLAQLPAEIIADDLWIAQVAHELIPILFPDGKAQHLWSSVIPGVREALERFKALKLQLVVVSNADGTVEQQLIDQQIRSYFDVVIDSDIVGVEKPDPEIFRIALSRSGANPESTLHVGDLYDVDVVGARSAGIHALLLDPYSDWQNVDCECLPDLLALAEKIQTLLLH